MPTVLIADDEPDHRELLTLALHRLGYDVVTAADASAALALLGEGGVDAAIVDVRMPGMSGIELCRRIRSSPETEFLPVMVVSADVHRQQISTALHAGADDFLAKPFSRAQLASRLEVLMRTRPSAPIHSAAVSASRAAILATRHALADDKQAQQPVPYLHSA